MSIRRLINILTLIISGMTIFASSALAADFQDVTSVENLEIRNGYEPGIGPAVGKIRRVAGTVLVLHQEQKHAFRAVQDLNLFKNDTILTGQDGNAAFALNDGSFVSLSPGTRMVINESVYAPNKKTRSSFMNMIAGKARFVVKKFVDARHSEFKVKTKTSVAGVRGSDFIIKATENVTEITTLEQTELEVISLAEPDAEPVILHDFEKTEVRTGKAPEEAQKVKSEEIDRLMKEFKFLPSDESPIQQEFTVSVVPVSLENIFVPEDVLIVPEFQDFRPVETQDDSLHDLLRSKKILMDEHDIEERNIEIYQEKSEAIQKTPLPDFPGAPE